MKKLHAAAAAGCALAVSIACAGPFDALKGKVKEGMYETKMEMDMGQMPGMPKGMGKQSMTHQQCVTHKDMDEGKWGKSGREGKGGSDCEVKDMKVTGNGATYSVACTKPQKMNADVKMTLTGTGYIMDMNTTMDHQGQPMKMSQHMEAKYLGPCTK